MPNKNFTLDDGLSVMIYKRRANRHLRLSITSSGQVRVSIPAWAPYRMGLEFARTRQDWIRDQQVTTVLLEHGQAIGKGHHLVFLPKAGITKPSSRLRDTEIIIQYPPADKPESPAIQALARKACERALRHQAEQLLPQRLMALAAAHDFDYASVTIKHLKRRWGSCDQRTNITLNLFLMQLPWELIDYVLLHELTHTRILRHGPPFWQAMAKLLPQTPALRRSLRQQQPLL